jgi:hypothetical protein
VAACIAGRPLGDEVEQGLGLGMKHRHSGDSSIEAR